MSRAYSPETWDLYEELDRDLEPEGPDSLLDMAAPYLFPGARVLDAGCRDAGHLIALVERHGARGIGVEPVAVHAGWARAAVAEAGLGDRVEIVEATLEAADLPTGSVDLVWCRDVLEQVPEPDAFLRVCARVLAAGGRVIAYTNVVGAALEPGEDALLRRHFGNVRANLDEPVLLAAFADAGLVVERREEIGTRWREWAEVRTRPVSQALLRLARLRRREEEIVAARGRDVYEHVEANLHWLLFQFLGKLKPVVYVLEAAASPS